MASLVDILLSFLKIGAFTFGGGYAMIPIIQHEVIVRRRWIAEQEFVDMLTLAQTAPGPISLNTAVFVGYKCRGFMGALMAILGVILPSFLVILCVAMFFSEVRDNRWVDAAFKGMRPAVVALIVAPIVGLMRGMRSASIAIAAATALVVWHFAISPVWLLIIAAVVGVVWAARGREVQR